METSATKKFLIDGFPRNEDNLEGWERQMGSSVDLKFVLYFVCSEQVCAMFFEFTVQSSKFTLFNFCLQTCLNRAMKRGLTGGRNDDNPDAFVKRYRKHSFHALSTLMCVHISLMPSAGDLPTATGPI